VLLLSLLLFFLSSCIFLLALCLAPPPFSSLHLLTPPADLFYFLQFIAAANLKGQYGSKFTPLTLAFFEDSGWYEVDYSYANCSVPQRDWGFKQGCDFVEKGCYAPYGEAAIARTSEPDHFCDVGNLKCSLTRDRPTVCGLSTWGADLPSNFQYFEDPKAGGTLPTADYCPL
jgi:hypothetical protein